jgi:hypothetical protein
MLILTKMLYATSSINIVTEISTLFKVSEERLIFEDKTDRVTKKEGNAVIAAYFIRSTDDQFPPIQVFITKGRFVFSEPMEKSLDGVSVGVTKVILKGGIPAYILVEGFGAGGEGHVGIVHFEKLNLDLKIRISIANDSSPERGKWHEILSSSAKLEAIIESLMNTTSDYINKNSSHFTAKTNDGKSEKVKAEKLALQKYYKDEATKDELFHDALDASSGNFALDYITFIWIIILCGLLALGWKYLLRKKI